MPPQVARRRLSQLAILAMPPMLVNSGSNNAPSGMTTPKLVSGNRRICTTPIESMDPSFQKWLCREITES
jgi:hypothetical protein